MRRLIIALAGAAGVFAGPSAVAFEMGPLNSILTTEKDDTWDARDEDDFFVLDNDEAKGAVRYYFLNPGEGDAGRRRVSVQLDLRDETRNSRGGLLYAFIPDPKSYFVFTLNADKSVSLFRISKGGMEQRLRSERKSVTDGLNTLALEEEGNLVHFYVNGERLSSLGNDRMGRGAVGIVALDIGEYAFRNFQVRLIDR